MKVTYVRKVYALNVNHSSTNVKKRHSYKEGVSKNNKRHGGPEAAHLRNKSQMFIGTN